MNVTKDVIADLWPLYADGASSADTRLLVETYLREHPEWFEKLRGGAVDVPLAAVAPVTADQQVQMLNRIKKRMRLLRILIVVPIMFTCQAFGRIVADTSWDVSPRLFIIFSALAALSWIWWSIAHWRVRRLGP